MRAPMRRIAGGDPGAAVETAGEGLDAAHPSPTIDPNQDVGARPESASTSGARQQSADTWQHIGDVLERLLTKMARAVK
jgi:hypothetical protein